MKLKLYKAKSWLMAASVLSVCMLLLNTALLAQDDSTAVAENQHPPKSNL